MSLRVTRQAAPFRWRRSDRWWEDAFLRVLGRKLSLTAEEIEKVAGRAGEFFERSRESAEDPPGQLLLLLACSVLAADVVLRGAESERVRAAIGGALVEPGAGVARSMVRLSLAWPSWRGRRDPLVVLRRSTRARVKDTYGSFFDFGEEIHSERFVSIVERCGLLEFFTEHGRPELTALFCAWDAEWTGALEEDRHGVRFDRPTTLLQDGVPCRFEFTRVASDGPSGRRNGAR
ncbi:MAG: L-2-amino-thiazoline-4-carboxylic acid hydrolase [Acidobacteriota bacterium]